MDRLGYYFISRDIRCVRLQDELANIGLVAQTTLNIIRVAYDLFLANPLC